MRRIIRSLIARPLAFSAIGITLLAAGAPDTGRAFADSDQASFGSADDAVTALVDAVRSENPKAAIVKILGPDGGDIASSGDAVADEARRSRFLASFEESHQIQAEDAAKSILVIGKDEFPFPIPLVAQDGKWRWDTASGLDQILTRRIGENELSAIEVTRAYVAAQVEYAEKERDGNGIQYARRLLSQEGRQDGLYWPAAENEDASPLGPLVAEAQSQGYKRSGSGDGQPAYHGYVFRMLYGQGRSAEGGARDYIFNDRMLGGFALIATPAEYGNSGIMTFIVNQDGDIYQTDLGPDSASTAARIKLFDPAETWKKVVSE